jgi:hypothetical protein
VLERAVSPGAGPIVATEIRAAVADMPDAPRVHSFAGGLGGRNLPLSVLQRLLAAAKGDKPVRFAVIDADPDKASLEDGFTEPAHA